MQVDLRDEFETKISLEKKIGRKNPFLTRMKTLIQNQIEGEDSDYDGPPLPDRKSSDRRSVSIRP